MKKNVMSSIWGFTIIFYFFANSTGVFAQEPASGAPLKTAKTETVLSDALLEVVFGTFKNYRHSSGWFSMSVPENWIITEKSVEDELIISIADPTENAAFVARVWSSQDTLGEDEMKNILEMFLNDSLSDFKNFSLGDSMRKNERVWISFKYDSVIEGKSYPMVGDSYIEQKGRIIGLSNLIMPKSQYDKRKDLVNKMMNSIKINPDNK